jgi:hypothetical protein
MLDERKIWTLFGSCRTIFYRERSGHPAEWEIGERETSGDMVQVVRAVALFLHLPLSAYPPRVSRLASNLEVKNMETYTGQ